MTQQTWTVPGPLARLLALLPSFPPAWLLAQALNAALAPLLPPELLATLAGRRLRLRVTDAGVHADFTVAGGRIQALGSRGAPDVSIAASAWDFLQLARRAEDPDALFFARRLVIEGDTELGLRLKNALDALDLPPLELSLPPSPRAVVRAVVRLRGESPTGRADPGV